MGNILYTHFIVEKDKDEKLYESPKIIQALFFPVA